MKQTAERQLYKTESVPHTVRLELPINEKVKVRAVAYRSIQRYFIALVEKDIATPDAPDCADCPHRIAVCRLAEALSKTA